MSVPINAGQWILIYDDVAKTYYKSNCLEMTEAATAYVEDGYTYVIKDTEAEIAQFIADNQLTEL